MSSIDAQEYVAKNSKIESGLDMYLREATQDYIKEWGYPMYRSTRWFEITKLKEAAYDQFYKMPIHKRAAYEAKYTEWCLR